MDAIDFTWIEIAADFQKDMDLLGWNLPAHYFSEGPQSLEHLIRDLLHTHPQQVREICYRLSISEWRLSDILVQKESEVVGVRLIHHVLVEHSVGVAKNESRL